jgi:hypothetical protein
MNYDNQNDRTVDITDTVLPTSTRGPFCVNDRVERLQGEKHNRWGTITGRANDETQEAWLVIDNDGVVHQDLAKDLAPARRKITHHSQPGEHR